MDCGAHPLELLVDGFSQLSTGIPADVGQRLDELCSRFSHTAATTTTTTNCTSTANSTEPAIEVGNVLFFTTGHSNDILIYSFLAVIALLLFLQLAVTIATTTSASLVRRRNGRFVRYTTQEDGHGHYDITTCSG